MTSRTVGASRTTADFIALHARRRPDHVAIVCDGREITYAALQHDLRRMTAALARLELRPDAFVAVEHPLLHPRLLVMLAFEQLGVLVAPFRVEEGQAIEAVLAEADVVLSASGIAAPKARRVLHMSADWLAGVLSEEPVGCVLAPRKPSDPMVMLRTSGSSGQPKQIVLTRAMVSARLAQRIVPLHYHRHDRFLAIMHFTQSGVYYAAHVCLRLGATVMANHDLAGRLAVTRFRPTSMLMLPYQLRALLNNWGDAPRLPELTITVVGAKLAPAMARQAAERLCGKVIEFYGASEVGMVCTSDENGLGDPVRGLTLELVGEDGAAVTAGVVGEIRLRGPAVFDGYRGNPAATAACLIDGWWHTGDFAVTMPYGRVRLLGRRDDVLNFGGIKHAAADIEARIQALGGYDVAVVAAEAGTGESVAAVCVAAAAAESASVARLAALIRTSMVGRFAVYRVDAIPRTPEGKVRRAVLGQTLANSQPVRPAAAV